MKALIFAAGLGTRLKPLTDSCPKALVEVGGVPMLRRVIEKLKDAGVDEMVVNIHHFPEMVRSFLSANNYFGIRIHVSDESTRLLETGGGLLKAREWLDGEEPFIVHNSDILTDFSIRDMWESHIRSGADATLMVSPRVSSRYLLFDSNKRMVGWTNVKSGEVRPEGLDVESVDKYAFGGVHVLSPSVFPMLHDYGADGRPFSITPFYIEASSRLDIRGYEPCSSYAWFDIGKPQTLESAENFLKKQAVKVGCSANNA